MKRLGSRSAGGHGTVADSSCPVGRYLWKQWRRFLIRKRVREEDVTKQISLLGRLGISPLPLPPSWYAVPLRLIVGLGFIEHGYAKLARGADGLIAILHAIGTPCRPARSGHHRRRDCGGIDDPPRRLHACG